jgi:acetolactate synthase-1/2/3 large subunit
MGAEGYRVTTKEEADEVLAKALKSKKPVIIDCVIGQDDMVFPMAPAGKPIENAFDQDDMNSLD